LRKNFMVIRDKNSIWARRCQTETYRDEPFVVESNNRRKHKIQNDTYLGNSRTFDIISDNVAEDNQRLSRISAILADSREFYDRTRTDRWLCDYSRERCREIQIYSRRGLVVTRGIQHGGRASALHFTPIRNTR